MLVNWASLWPPCVAGADIICLPCGFFYLLSFFFPRLISVVAYWMSAILTHMVWLWCIFKTQVWNVLHAARWKYRTQKVVKNRHLDTIPQLCPAISSQLRHLSTIGKKLLSSNISSTCIHNMVNLGLLAAEIGQVVWGTPANFNGFRVLAALLHGTLVLGVSQTLRRWTEGATYIRQGSHHVGHRPILVMAAVWNKAGHYIFAHVVSSSSSFFLSSFFLA